MLAAPGCSSAVPDAAAISRQKKSVIVTVCCPNRSRQLYNNSMPSASATCRCNMQVQHAGATCRCNVQMASSSQQSNCPHQHNRSTAQCTCDTRAQALLSNSINDRTKESSGAVAAGALSVELEEALGRAASVGHSGPTRQRAFTAARHADDQG